MKKILSLEVHVLYCILQSMESNTIDLGRVFVTLIPQQFVIGNNVLYV